MSRPSLVVLACLVLSPLACVRSPPVPPGTEVEPPTQEDPLDGKELGADKTDEAKIVEPGPADAEVRTGDDAETHPR